jgi:hypothetical protein
MNKLQQKFGLLLFLAPILFFSCSDLKVKKPEGFAEVLKRSNTYKAVSPEGMSFKIRTVKNYPQMKLDFWSDTLKNHLQKEGYMLITDGEALTATNLNGKFYEWGVPYAEKSFVYLTALFIRDKQIIIAEAGAEYSIYASYKTSILQSLKDSQF